MKNIISLQILLFYIISIKNDTIGLIILKLSQPLQKVRPVQLDKITICSIYSLFNEIVTLPRDVFIFGKKKLFDGAKSGE